MTDAVIVGSGPNGLSAAIAMARAGCKVVVFEADDAIGGAVRSAELTLPGFVHDVCSAVHPFAIASPFWKTLPLTEHGLEWIEPEVMVAHPLDEGDAVIAERSLDATANGLGIDAGGYRRTVGALVADWPKLDRAVLGPLTLPRHPFSLGRFGSQALRSAEGLANSAFTTARAKALFAGIAAHGMLPLDRPLSAGVGLALGAMCHVAGWPMPRGGAQRLTDALVSHLKSLGGEVVTGSRVDSIDALGPCCATCRRSRCCGSQDTSSQPGIAPHSSTIAMGWACSRWIGRSPNRFHGPLPPAGAPARSMSAARSKRSPPPSARRGKDASPIAPSCC
jgi:phytoene dehydrogenase-like protein